jgi:small subunit ribosomal protein S8
MTDPISDMITRIRNASLAKKYEVVLPMSKMKQRIAEIIKQEGWIEDFQIISGRSLKGASHFDEIKISLKYKKSGRSVISAITRISKPGLRIYVKKDELPRVQNNLGVAILSTPQGLMTNKEARKKNIGGEVLFEIY